MVKRTFLLVSDHVQVAFSSRGRMSFNGSCSTTASPGQPLLSVSGLNSISYKAMRSSYSVFTFFGGDGSGTGCRPLLPLRCWVGASWMMIPHPLYPPRLAGVRSSSATSGFGVRSADMPREEEDPEPNDDDEAILLDTQGWEGGGAGAMKEGDRV